MSSLYALHRSAARASAGRARLVSDANGEPFVSIARRRAGITVRIAFAACIVMLAAGCASTPPKQQGNLCAVFEQYPDWYDYARNSAEEWGTPVHILMAFVRHESSYRSNARPPREWFLFIRWDAHRRPRLRAGTRSGVGEYQQERGRLFRSRSDMEDALDFVGWYKPQDLAGSSVSPARMPTGSTLPTTRGGAVIGAAPGRTNPECSAPRSGCVRRPAPTSRSSRVARRGSAAIPGTRCGPCATDGAGDDGCDCEASVARAEGLGEGSGEVHLLHPVVPRDEHEDRRHVGERGEEPGAMPIPWLWAWNWRMFTPPKSSAPSSTRSGLQLATTTSASAIQPRPEVMFSTHSGV